MLDRSNKNQELNKEDTKVSINDSNDNIGKTEIELNFDNEDSEIDNNCDISEDVTANLNNETSEDIIDEIHGDSMVDTTEIIARNPNNNNQNNELLDRQERINRFFEDVMSFLNNEQRTSEVFYREDLKFGVTN